MSVIAATTPSRAHVAFNEREPREPRTGSWASCLRALLTVTLLLLNIQGLAAQINQVEQRDSEIETMPAVEESASGFRLQKIDRESESLFTSQTESWQTLSADRMSVARRDGHNKDNALRLVSWSVGDAESGGITPEADGSASRTSSTVVSDRTSGTASDDDAAATDAFSGPDFSQLEHDTDKTLLQFIDVFQWVLLVMILAVAAAFSIRKWKLGGNFKADNDLMEHVATLPVRNLFQAHLLRVGDRKFLVTTDRSGVRTVDAVNAWDEFSESEEEETGSITEVTGSLPS